MGYRKLSDEELNNYGISQKEVPAALKSHVVKFYPSNVSVVSVIYSSEYNDEYYDNKVVSLVCMDSNGNEVSPIKGKEIKARQEMVGVYLHESYGDGDTEAKETETYFIGKLPELYVKE